MKPDIVIEMEFSMKADKVQIRTNAKRDKVVDLLEDYLHSCVGTGKDPAPAEDHEVYKITLGVELGEDSWGSAHNCGNRGLREGIVMRVLKMLMDETDRVTFVE